MSHFRPSRQIFKFINIFPNLYQTNINKKKKHIEIKYIKYTIEFDTASMLTAGKSVRPVVAKSDSDYGAIEMLLIQSRLQSMEFLRQYSNE